jgi:hypothetical protein
MGKSILIIVLGMSVIVSFVILKLNANSKMNLSNTVNMLEQTQARLIANSGVEIYLEKLKHDRNMLNNSYPNNNLFNGTYDITIYGPEEEVMVTSIASFGETQHTTIVTAAADKVPFHPGPAAMYLSAGTIAGLKKNAVNGNIEINGNDHNINGVQIEGEAVPGVAVDGEEQRQSFIALITKNTIDQVLGAGPAPSVAVVNNQIDWAEYAQMLADNPDILIDIQDKIKSTNVWGTLSDPKVTFVNGDIHINNSQAASGCGILVVNGSLTINGNFNFIGIVIAFKNTTIDLKLNGNASILGSLVVAGNQINVEVANGNFKALYSTEALHLVQSLLVTKRFTIITWWE